VEDQKPSKRNMKSLPIHKNSFSTSPHSFLFVSPLPQVTMKHHKNVFFWETWENKLISCKPLRLWDDNSSKRICTLVITNGGKLHSPSRTWATASGLLGAKRKSWPPSCNVVLFLL